jgi:L-amino acid N-acyltransferase YncA
MIIKPVSLNILPMTPADWPQVCAIYREGITTGLATFETEAPTWEQWDIRHHPFCRLAAREVCEQENGPLLGWAALGPVSVRPVYAGVAEVSIYVGSVGRRQGVGSALLQELIVQSEEHGIWTLQAVIFPENTASLHLHLGVGFRLVGRRERIGMLNGIWHDTLLMERRTRDIE